MQRELLGSPQWKCCKAKMYRVLLPFIQKSLNRTGRKWWLIDHRAKLCLLCLLYWWTMGEKVGEKYVQSSPCFYQSPVVGTFKQNTIWDLGYFGSYGQSRFYESIILFFTFLVCFTDIQFTILLQPKCAI